MSKEKIIVSYIRNCRAGYVEDYSLPSAPIFLRSSNTLHGREIKNGAEVVAITS